MYDSDIFSLVKYICEAEYKQTVDAAAAADRDAVTRATADAGSVVYSQPCYARFAAQMKQVMA